MNHHHSVRLQECGQFQCFFTNERAARLHPSTRTVLFYGTDFKPYDAPVPRGKQEDWALFHEESPKNNPIFAHQAMMGLLNHTATFRRSSDLPLVTQYLVSLDSITDPGLLIPLSAKNRMVREGLAPVAYVQSGCDTPLGRDTWVTEFMKFVKVCAVQNYFIPYTVCVKVDSYGECLHNKPLSEDIRGSEKMDSKEYLNLLAKYKFVISIENAVCEDYVTEKLWRTLQVGAVPIYLGAPNIEQYLPHPDSAILVKNFHNVSAVAAEVLKLPTVFFI